MKIMMILVKADIVENSSLIRRNSQSRAWSILITISVVGRNIDAYDELDNQAKVILFVGSCIMKSTFEWLDSSFDIHLKLIYK